MTEDLNWTSTTRENQGLVAHEKPFREWILKNLQLKGIFLDVGAALGVYSMVLAPHFSQVYAVEPNPTNAALMRENILLNGLKNIAVIEKAAWNVSGKKLFINQELGTANTLSGASTFEEQSSPGWIVVESLRLDDLNLAPNFVKMDVEGAGLFVLQGLEETIKKHHPTIFLELHMGAVAERGESRIPDLLRERGYAPIQNFSGRNDFGGNSIWT